MSLGLLNNNELVSSQRESFITVEECSPHNAHLEDRDARKGGLFQKVERWRYYKY